MTHSHSRKSESLESLLDLMIRFNLANMLSSHAKDTLGSYLEGTLGSYQGGTVPHQIGATVTPGGVTTINPGTAGGGGGGGGAGQYGTPEEISQYLATQGAGFLDPGSDLSKQWMEKMRGQIGDQTDAAQRAAGYQAAQQGFGGGASPELLQMQGELGVQGLEAGGQAAADFMLRAPTLGAGMMGGALGGQVGMRGQDLSSAQYTSSNQLALDRLEEEKRQFDIAEDRRRAEDAQNAADLQALIDQYIPGGGGGSALPTTTTQPTTTGGTNPIGGGTVYTSRGMGSR